MKNFENTSYKDMVSILAKPGNSIVDEMTCDKAYMLHMSACTMEEIGELILRTSKENTKEELGDIMFYLQGMSNYLDFTVSITDSNYAALRCITADVVLFTEAAKLYSILKPWFFYNKSLDRNKAYKQLVVTYHAFYNALKQFGYTAEEIESANKTKLSKRYHKLHYSDEQAQTRADKCGDSIT